MANLIRTPRFWDLHIHGVCGVDFMHADADAMAFACEALGKNGIGYFAPTLLTAEPKLLEDAVRRWGAFLKKCRSSRKFLSPLSAHPLGLHLEGPYLNPEMAGAHPKAWLKRPTVSALTKLITLAQGEVAIVTIAPELPGAMEAIRSLSKKGVRVQLGHTQADPETILKAVRAGAQGVTHLFNAMKVHHRNPGVLTAVAEGQLTAELITDGLHLDGRFTVHQLSALGGRVYAVSDGCSAVDSKPGALLTLGSLTLKKEGAAALVKSTGTLAGGATYLTQHPARLKKAFERQTSLRPQSFWPIFYELQSGIVGKRFRNHSTISNIFDPKRWHFCGTDHA